MSFFEFPICSTINGLEEDVNLICLPAPSKVINSGA